jgi:cytoskeletal protein CcmA (bactofilin family)
MRRSFVLAVGVALLLVVSAAPAYAAAAAEGRGDSLVVLTGDAVVPVGETVETVVVFDGAVEIAGRVSETVVVLNGPTTVTGHVGGDVIVLSGQLTLADGSFVGGDVYAERRSIEPGAAVQGAVRSPASIDWALGWASAITMLAVWFAIAVSVLVLGLALIGLAPRAADATYDAVRTSLGPSIGWGLLVFIGLPIVGAAAVGTLVGIPLGIALLFGLALIFAIGQTAGAWFLGRRLVRGPSRAVSFLLGWAIVSGLGLVPGLGGLIWFGTTVAGLGAIAVAVWRVRRAPAAATAPASSGGATPPPLPAGA